MVRLIFLFVFGAMAWRLASLQLLEHPSFSKADLAHIGSAPIHEPRGNIYDRQGQLLATDGEQPALCADPSIIENPQALALELERRLGLDRNETLKKFERKSRFAYLQKELTPVDIESLGNLREWAGRSLWLNDEPVRVYAQGDVAAHVLGFVNKEHVGGVGLEAQFDAFLRSTPGKRTANKDHRGVLIASSREDYVAPGGGDDLHLTIDTVIQHALEDALDRRLTEVNAPRGMGIIMDPHTGAILALATRPAFDPNRFFNYPPEAWRNNAVTDVFEPGSAFKIVVAAAALELGLLTPDTKIDCMDGRMRIGRRTINDVHKMGVEPFRMCFAESSNIAMVQVGAMLGEQRLYDWIRAFGFGEKACPDLPLESSGILRPVDQWSGYSMGSLPMGQEVSVTMPQLARAFSIIANGGYFVEPYVVDKVVGRDGNIVYKHELQAHDRVLSDETARMMQELCHLVVTKGTGGPASIDTYRVGGKTGTAQMSKEGERGYAEDAYTAVFAGFAPVSNPKLVGVIVVQEPHIRLHYGGHVCGPVFREVVHTALRYMHVPQDPVVGLVADREGAEDADSQVFQIDEALLDSFLDDDAILSELENLETLPQDDAAWGPVVPSVIGLTRREAMERLAKYGLRWDMQGSGWVVTQDPAPGSAMEGVELCRLVLDRKPEQIDAPASP